jgi:hypothetical protein
MSTKNQRLNATVTIGSVLEASVKRNIGFLKSGLNQVGDAIKDVERRQKDLDRQRNVLRKQGQSVELLDREYEKLERTLQGLRRAQERWNRAAAASRRVGSTFKSMAADIGRNARNIAIGASLAGGAVFGLASSTAQLGDDVAKTADKLGIGIEQLQELRYAAERSGVSTSSFDAALEKMQKNLGEAATGTGTAKDALKELGLSAEQLINKSPDEALGIIADRMQGVETAAERATLANDIFGRSGIGMINMLRGGSDGLIQLRKDAQRTGYVLSEKAARDAEVFQDTLLDTQLVMKGLKNTVGAELMPVVTTAMRRVGDALVSNRSDVKRWAETFADGVERALPIVGEVVTGIGQVSSVVWGVVDSTAEMVGGWENFGIVIGAALASRTVVRVAKFGAAVFSLGRSMFALARSTPLVVGGIRAIGSALLMNPIGLAVAAIAGSAFLIYKNWEAVGPWFKARWENVKTYFSGFADFVGGVFTADLSRAWSGIKQMWGAASAFFKGVWDGIGAIFVATWENAIKPVTDALGVTDQITSAWNTVKNSLGQVLDWIGSKFQWLGEIIMPVIDGLKWVKDKGAAALQSVGIGGGPDIGEVARDSAINTGDSGIGQDRRAQVLAAQRERLKAMGVPEDKLPPLQKRALGGPFGPGWSLTGELGPELKFENRSGYVANNRAMRQLAGYADRIGGMMAPQRPSSRGSAMSDRINALFSRAAGAVRASSASNQVTQNISYTINAAGASADEIIRLIERKSRQAAGNGLYDRASAIGPYGR